jgi:hypothetical protein
LQQYCQTVPINKLPKMKSRRVTGGFSFSVLYLLILQQICNGNFIKIGLII